MYEQKNGELEERKARSILLLVIIYSIVLFGVIAIVSYFIWCKKDPCSNPIIMFVPIAIWEWSFAGGMAAVLYRLGSTKLRKPDGLQLYSWAIATPVTGLFLGAIVYFVALAGARLVGGPESLQNANWLNVIAFFGGFRGDLSISVVKRFFGSKVQDDDDFQGEA